MATNIPVGVGNLVGIDYLNEVARAHWRKASAKTVNTTAAATDLFNGNISIDAGAMGSTRILRVNAWGDWLQNSGGTAAPPRFQLVFGGTTLLDTSTAGAAACTNAATRFGWSLQFTIQNATASSQTCQVTGSLANNAAVAWGAAFTTGTGTYTSPTVSVSGLAQIVGINSALTVNTALAQTLVLNVINGSASATYETKLLGAFVEVM
jgi:hypothetical protein